MFSANKSSGSIDGKVFAALSKDGMGVWAASEVTVAEEIKTAA